MGIIKSYLDSFKTPKGVEITPKDSPELMLLKINYMRSHDAANGFKIAIPLVIITFIIMTIILIHNL